MAAFDQLPRSIREAINDAAEAGENVPIEALRMLRDGTPEFIVRAIVIDALGSSGLNRRRS